MCPWHHAHHRAGIQECGYQLAKMCVLGKSEQGSVKLGDMGTGQRVCGATASGAIVLANTLYKLSTKIRIAVHYKNKIIRGEAGTPLEQL